MRPITLTLIATLTIFVALLCCKKEPEPCWETCKYPRSCNVYECACSNGGFYYADMCWGKENKEYLAMLPEEDFLDTFALWLESPAVYGYRSQSESKGSSISQYGRITLPGYDSMFIFRLRPPGSGPVIDGWPTLNDKKFLFYFYGIIKHENRDTLYARLRWIGLGSGDDLREPIDFKMHVPKYNPG
jgi:hypothetical protein